MDAISAESPYTLRLEDAGALPVDLRIRAEARFCVALEKAAGGPDRVVPLLRAYEKAGEMGSKPTGALLEQATQWGKAWAFAIQAGTKDFGEDQSEAFFDIRAH